MSPGEWRGNKIPGTNRILILGESHYGDENSDRESIGGMVPYKTAGVVQDYLSHRVAEGGSARWDRFFDRVAESFGYSTENSKEFYEKVIFGNYVPILCEVGDKNPAKVFIKKHRTEYNNQLFKFVNENDIRIIVCFSKEVYWKLPSSSSEAQEKCREITLPNIGGKRNVINVYEYASAVSHAGCEVALSSTLTVYGVRHPSARGGYNSQAVYHAFIKEESLSSILIHN